ncbi:hypothetical protein CANTEDRAFT_112221 [Yamadazyma tenuis ATCC 10573]|uniref:MFS general substrate transporter n=1 Tax=Candida tenuis (strain ATCC 10573 / BCRC 21748 / CBS 615 / JCM 9827 / NBRC 10315 / NRRL Y-1498 / VKM Y-70) TaxID=590646 RepID=G3AWB6_CANTC|nr:MFS general substrate transporter [Yamadazyma tenuis ATCC 10573]XP_006684041.1 uncharacterized protein CANTEDRAFT_112221 [Yamadazyma tenuis ATCC 10573]EGV66782.1 MFS general substrate transporter [Yamadazyma tenuis ATCC 10573]EGV66783.1 hypothetical protein CANTEDRAFT_112221 [Yamadazyma tenuis ATCC 10573]
MGLSTFVHQSFWGRVFYHFSGGKLFSYKEEAPDYIIPDKYLDTKKSQIEESEETVEDSGSSVSSSNSASDCDTETLQVGDRILVTWDGEDDPDNPKNWPLWQKIIFMFEISFLTVSVYMASAIYTPGVDYIIEDLGVSKIKATLPLTMFVVGYGIGPMIFSPASENAIFGRTNIYIVTLFIFFLLQIPISLVNNLAALTVLRFISGFFASPVLGTGGASMGDVIDKPYMPIAIGVWSMGAVCGPSLGPMFGSIMIVKRNWHWTFWLICMLSGIAFVILSWFLPETYEKTLLLRKAERLRKLTGNDKIVSEGEIENQGLTSRQLFIDTLWRPFEIMLFEPIVFSIDMYIALVYSIMYLWFEAFPIVFADLYHFALIPLGLSFLSVLVGICCSAVVYVFIMHRKYTKRKLRGEYVPPEVFLPTMILGSISMPIGVFIFGWSATAKAHWMGPMIGAGIFCFGAFINFQTSFNYLGSSFPRYLASVFAGNAFLRSVIAGCFPLFGAPLFNNLATPNYPVGWGSSLLGFIATIMIIIPVVFYLKGPSIRARSKYSGD